MFRIVFKIFLVVRNPKTIVKIKRKQKVEKFVSPSKKYAEIIPASEPHVPGAGRKKPI